VERNARAKLVAKRLDLLAANRVGQPGSGFEATDNALVLYGADGSREDLGRASKAELARLLVVRIAARLATRAARP
jgi:phosphopantothenoylcysteine decarboxylase/phosphopantothenate--cysteine ligase